MENVIIACSLSPLSLYINKSLHFGEGLGIITSKVHINLNFSYNSLYLAIFNYLHKNFFIPHPSHISITLSSDSPFSTSLCSPLRYVLRECTPSFILFIFPIVLSSELYTYFSFNDFPLRDGGMTSQSHLCFLLCGAFLRT